MNKKIKRLLCVLIAILVVVLVISGIVWAVSKTNKPAFLAKLLGREEVLPYSLVYVQVGSGTASYYGQIVNNKHSIITLKNPSYIDVQQSAKEGEQPQISFRFMKDDFFKPKPEITIYKQNIVFIQELSADSPIIQAYKNAK